MVWLFVLCICFCSGSDSNNAMVVSIESNFFRYQFVIMASLVDCEHFIFFGKSLGPFGPLGSLSVPFLDSPVVGQQKLC